MRDVEAYLWRPAEQQNLFHLNLLLSLAEELVSQRGLGIFMGCFGKRKSEAGVTVMPYFVPQGVLCHENHATHLQRTKQGSL